MFNTPVVVPTESVDEDDEEAISRQFCDIQSPTVPSATRPRYQLGHQIDARKKRFSLEFLFLLIFDLTL